MLTILATKQWKGESTKAFAERFRNITLRCPSGMTQTTLVEAYRHNLQTQLLAQMGVVESRIWKLVQHNELAKEIVTMVKAETGESRPALERPPKRAPEQSCQPNKKDTLVAKAKSSSAPQLARAIPRQPEGVVLQIRLALLGNIVSKTSMSNHCSSSSARATNWSTQRLDARKKWGGRTTWNIACITGY